MGGLNWLEMVSSILFVAVCAMAGALILMQRMDAILREEREYELASGNANLIGAVVGGIAGLGIAIICVYYYLISSEGGGWVLWTGRLAYTLILGASAGHLVLLIHVWLRLDTELRDLKGKGKGPQSGTLSLRRRKALDALHRSQDSSMEARARDDAVLEDLMAVFGERLLTGQRALNRIPFYGYLGTVCGILLMAENLTQLDEATESFQVLRNMAGGLVLAFQTTLVALLAYLPLRKIADLLMNRMAEMERIWLALREEILEGDSQ